MANTSVTGDNYGFFWHSRGGDRQYSPTSFELWLKKFFTSGVYDSDLQVTSTGGMGISVGSGYANVDGKVKFFKAATPFTIASASANSPRIDTVVVERNDGDRNVTLKVIQGEYAETPEPTPPVREDGVYQLVLAQIYVGVAVSQITQSNITDTRMNSVLCGWVSSTITEINYDQAYAQFTTWFDEYKESIIDDFSEAGEMAQIIFNAWFNHMKGQLTEDAAGQLQVEIDEVNQMIADAYSVVGLYNVGDKVTYENHLYVCKYAVTTRGDFDPYYWEERQVQDEIEEKVSEFESGLTTFNTDGSITTTYNDRVKNTVFNHDGSISETLSKNGVVYKTKTTTFNQDGSITEIVS